MYKSSPNSNSDSNTPLYPKCNNIFKRRLSQSLNNFHTNWWHKLIPNFFQRKISIHTKISSCGFVEARCRPNMSGCGPPTYELCRYPRTFPFNDLSPGKQSLSLPYLSLDMLGLPSDWRCTCVHTHAFHIHHPTITTHIFLYCSTSLVLVSQTIYLLHPVFQ